MIEYSGPQGGQFVDQVYLVGKQIGNDVLPELAAFGHLRSLTLRSTGVTDAGMKTVAGLKQLESLYLEETKITDAGLADLTLLPKLTGLSVCDVPVTDAGTRLVAKIPSLDMLRFSRHVSYRRRPCPHLWLLRSSRS